MSDIEPLLDGYRSFRERYFQDDPGLYRDTLQHGQSPRYAVVACSDSRVDPAIVLNTEPGDIFTVRNVAALVPPYDMAPSHPSAGAAIEYAVNGLKVGHIIVIGHVLCGGVAAMVSRQEGGPSSGELVEPWTNLLRQARDRALAEDPGLSGDALLRACERHSVRLSLDNLMTYPFVRDQVDAGALGVHGWYFDFVAGRLERWNPEAGAFEAVD